MQRLSERKFGFRLEDSSVQGHDKDRASSPHGLGTGGVQAECAAGSLGGGRGGVVGAGTRWLATARGGWNSDVSEGKSASSLLVGLGVADASGDGHHGQGLVGVGQRQDAGEGHVDLCREHYGEEELL